MLRKGCLLTSASSARFVDCEEERMAKKRVYIDGFVERLEEACYNSGLNKTEIARRCNFSRKQLMRRQTHWMMNSGDLAKFCAVTKTDANWLLGIKR